MYLSNDHFVNGLYPASHGFAFNAFQEQIEFV